MVNGELADEGPLQFCHLLQSLAGRRHFRLCHSNRRLKIHRINCPNATNMMVNYGYRVMKAEWVAIGKFAFCGQP